MCVPCIQSANMITKYTMMYFRRKPSNCVFKSASLDPFSDFPAESSSDVYRYWVIIAVTAKRAVITSRTSNALGSNNQRHRFARIKNKSRTERESMSHASERKFILSANTNILQLTILASREELLWSYRIQSSCRPILQQFVYRVENKFTAL